MIVEAGMDLLEGDRGLLAMRSSRTVGSVSWKKMGHVVRAAKSKKSAPRSISTRSAPAFRSERSVSPGERLSRRPNGSSGPERLRETNGRHLATKTTWHARHKGFHVSGITAQGATGVLLALL